MKCFSFLWLKINTLIFSFKSAVLKILSNINCSRICEILCIEKIKWNIIGSSRLDEPTVFNSFCIHMEPLPK